MTIWTHFFSINVLPISLLKGTRIFVWIVTHTALDRWTLIVDTLYYYVTCQLFYFPTGPTLLGREPVAGVQICIIYLNISVNIPLQLKKILNFIYQNKHQFPLVFMKQGYFFVILFHFIGLIITQSTRQQGDIHHDCIILDFPYDAPDDHFFTFCNISAQSDICWNVTSIWQRRFIGGITRRFLPGGRGSLDIFHSILTTSCHLSLRVFEKSRRKSDSSSCVDIKVDVVVVKKKQQKKTNVNDSDVVDIFRTIL